MTSISIIIPTYNRLESLKKVLAALEKQIEPTILFEVIVVSDGSNDGTTEYLQNLSSIYPHKVVLQQNLGVAAARNAGITCASGELIVFLDDDVVPAPQLLQEHLNYHHRFGSLAVVIGPMLTPVDARLAPWIQWEQEKLDQQYKDMIAGKWKPTARQFYTGNVSLARVHLLEIGGFDPTFRRAEDVELAYRLADKGLKFYFNPSAVGYHYADRTFNSWLGTPYAYGNNDVIFSEKKGQKWLLPLIFEEYHKKNIISRFFIYLCLDNPLLSRGLTLFLKNCIAIGSWFNISFLCNAACSILFHFHYYQGISDGIGGRRIFYMRVKKARTEFMKVNLL